MYATWDGQTVVLVAAAAGMIGAVVVWLLMRPRLHEDALRIAQAADQARRLETDLATATAFADDLRTQVSALRAVEARLTTSLDAERQASEEKVRVLQQAEQRLRETFDGLSAQALARNNESFLALARTQLGEFQQVARTELESRQAAVDGLVAPLRESVAAVHLKLGEIEKERHGAYSALTTQLQSLVQAEQALRSETATLSRALRSPSARGRWGEIQLQRVVELAGMVEYCDYLTQETVNGSDGRLRPDMVVRLPGGKRLVVDAKAPLSAYLEALEATDDLQRETKLRDHARQVKDHMKRLGAKAYQDQFTPAPEFVVMFLPGETFFGAAMQQDPTLIEYGVDQRVIPASPTTLIALLRAVAYGWRQESLAENARKICDEGAALYERLATMAAHFGRMGGALRKAVEHHDATLGALERRVLPTARRLRDLSAANDTALPDLERLDLQPRTLQATELGALPEVLLPLDADA